MFSLWRDLTISSTYESIFLITAAKELNVVSKLIMIRFENDLEINVTNEITFNLILSD